MSTYEVTRGPHYDHPTIEHDADAKTAVPEPYWKQLLIIFPAKCVVRYMQIISSHLYFRSKGTC